MRIARDSVYLNDGRGQVYLLNTADSIGRQLIKAPYVKLYSILKTSSTSADSEQIQDSEVPITTPPTVPVIDDIYH